MVGSQIYRRLLSLSKPKETCTHVPIAPCESNDPKRGHTCPGGSASSGYGLSYLDTVQILRDNLYSVKIKHGCLAAVRDVVRKFYPTPDDLLEENNDAIP
jgi:hypothetical protein